jgi:hypothetical protein
MRMWPHTEEEEHAGRSGGARVVVAISLIRSRLLLDLFLGCRKKRKIRSPGASPNDRHRLCPGDRTRLGIKRKNGSLARPSGPAHLPQVPGSRAGCLVTEIAVFVLEEGSHARLPLASRSFALTRPGDLG